MVLTLDTIADWLRHRGSGMYGGEAVTQLEHALQCATLAKEDGASAELIVAALLHDICHLAPDTDDRRQPHEKLAGEWLADLFSPSVTEPIRLHVDAKCYLCAIDPLYWSTLSPMSQKSLAWQGGPFSPEEAADFSAQLYAEDAERLRRWDDAAKIPGKATLPLDDFIELMRSVSLYRQVA